MEPIIVRSRTSRGLRSSKPATSGNPGACVPSGTRTGDGPTIQHGTHAIGERVRLHRLRSWLVLRSLPANSASCSRSSTTELRNEFYETSTNRVVAYSDAGLRPTFPFANKAHAQTNDFPERRPRRRGSIPPPDCRDAKTQRFFLLPEHSTPASKDPVFTGGPSIGTSQRTAVSYERTQGPSGRPIHLLSNALASHLLRKCF